MIKKILILSASFIFVACSSINKELQLQEELLVSSGDNEQLVEFYKLNLLENPEFKVKLVNLYLDMDDIKSAELYRNTYDDSDLNIAENIYSIARISYEKNALSESKKALEKYVDKGGNRAKYHLLNGKIYAKQRRYARAVEEFEMSRTLGVSDRESSNNIAVVKLMQGQYSEATKILLNLYLENPNDNRVRSNLIIASVKSGRPDIALDALKKTNSEPQAKSQLATLMKSVSKQNKLKPFSNNLNYSQISRHKITNNTLTQKKIESKINNVNMSSVHHKNYRVQVFASTKNLSIEYLDYLKNNYGKVYAYKKGIWYRYCVGDFNNLNKAREFIKSIDVKDAFIVDYYGQEYFVL